MKKVFSVVMLFFLASALFAQSSKIAGSWLLTRAETGGKVQTPFIVMNFKTDGSLELMDVPMGSWKSDQKSTRLTLESKLQKNLNGDAKVLKLTANQFVFEKDGTKYSFSRMNPDEVARKNEQSGLAGTWNLQGTDYPTAMLEFKLPNSFTLLQADNVETDRASGSWFFNPEDHSIIFNSFSHLLRGKVKISELKSDSFTLGLPERTLKAQRQKSEGNKIERLTFKEEDFPEEPVEGPYHLPWQDLYEMAQFLSTVQSVQYKFGTLVPDFNTLKYTSSLLSKVVVDAQKPSIKFTNLSVSQGDTSQYSQKYRGGLTESNNAFFPQEELWSYRITGIETVSVPAGTFECTVVEGMDGDKKLKMWMINNMPGIYAKIIQEETDPFGDLEYSLKELEKITYQDKN